jgi:hypothetical protein
MSSAVDSLPGDNPNLLKILKAVVCISRCYRHTSIAIFVLLAEYVSCKS